MNINVRHGLPFVSVVVTFKGNELRMDKVLLDTVSAGTIFNADLVRTIGVIPEGDDRVRLLHHEKPDRKRSGFCVEKIG